MSVLIWVITAVVAAALPFIWARERRSPWAWAWAIMAIFAVFELWESEYRLGVAQAWKSACLRNAELLQQCSSKK